MTKLQGCWSKGRMVQEQNKQVSNSQLIVICKLNKTISYILPALQEYCFIVIRILGEVILKVVLSKKLNPKERVLIFLTDPHRRILYAKKFSTLIAEDPLLKI